MMTDTCHIWADSKGNLIVHILSFMIEFLLLAFRFLSSLVDLRDSCQWGLDMIFGGNLLVIGGRILVVGGWILITGGWILVISTQVSTIYNKYL
jgi:hypothetical protein